MHGKMLLIFSEGAKCWRDKPLFSKIKLQSQLFVCIYISKLLAGHCSCLPNASYAIAPFFLILFLSLWFIV